MNPASGEHRKRNMPTDVLGFTETPERGPALDLAELITDE